MSLSQIRYFVAVAEESHVGRAAQRLHVAQPPISRQIRALEEEIGAPLFVRTPRGMTLLPQGRVFLDHARSILAALDHAIVATRAEATSPAGNDRAPGPISSAAHKYGRCPQDGVTSPSHPIAAAATDTETASTSPLGPGV